VVCFDVDHVTQPEQAAGDLFKAAIRAIAQGNSLALSLAEGIGLSFASALGHGLGKVGEQHREPKP
jgi:hypothetical protein